MSGWNADGPHRTRRTVNCHERNGLKAVTTGEFGTDLASVLDRCFVRDFSVVESWTRLIFLIPDPQAPGPFDRINRRIWKNLKPQGSCG
jgi:hypothetical protein